MTDAMTTSPYYPNPLAPMPEQGEPVFRLTAQSAAPESTHPDIPERKLYNVSIVFANAHDGVAIEEISSHSHFMTADVLGISPTQTGNLTASQVDGLFARVKTGEFFPRP